MASFIIRGGICAMPVRLIIILQANTGEEKLWARKIHNPTIPQKASAPAGRNCLAALAWWSAMKKLPANGQFLLGISSFASIHLQDRSLSQPVEISLNHDTSPIFVVPLLF